MTRGVADLGLIVAVGAVGAWVLLGARSTRVRRLALAAALLGAGGSLAVAGLTLAESGQAAVGGIVLTTTLLRAALLFGVAATIAVAAGRPVAWRTALGLGAAGLATMMFGGHPNEAPLTAVLLLAHLAGASLWLGAAPAVLLVLLDRTVDDATTLKVVRRFSRLATVTLLLAVIGGSLLALRLTDPMSRGLEGLDPRYLSFLVLKIGIVATAALLGAVTRRRLGHDTAGRSSLRALFAVDSTLLVVVVACSAALTVGPPRVEAAPDDGIHVGHCPLVLEDGTASLSLNPARVGDTVVYLDGAGTLDSALVELRPSGEAGAVEVELRPSGVSWSAPVAVPVAGVWEATVALRPDRFSEERVTCELRVQP